MPPKSGKAAFAAPPCATNKPGKAQKSIPSSSKDRKGEASSRGLENWNSAFWLAELVEMKLPMMSGKWEDSASGLSPFEGEFGRLSLRPAPGFTIAEGRHLKPREMTVHSMFGRFHCPNPKCKSKSWSSTSCNTDVRYRFDEREQRGEIVIVEEFGQQCKRCNHMVKPEFDLEATERAMSKIVERIKKGPSHV